MYNWTIMFRKLLKYVEIVYFGFIVIDILRMSNTKKFNKKIIEKENQFLIHLLIFESTIIILIFNMLKIAHIGIL